MKKYIINFMIYFIILSVAIGVLTLLFGIPTFLLIKFIASLALAYFKPLVNIK